MQSSFFGVNSAPLFESQEKLIAKGATSDSYKVKMWGHGFF